MILLLKVAAAMLAVVLISAAWILAWMRIFIFISNKPLKTKKNDNQKIQNYPTAQRGQSL